MFQRIKSKIQNLRAPRVLGRRRGRLVRDYFFISVLLIGGGLITSGLVEIYFRYLESREQLAAVQKEVATGAAVKIERFVQEIHNTLKGATKSREIAPKGLTTEFRFELEKLLLIAPAVTEALALDEKGAIRVQASRLRTVLPEAKRDLANAAPFQTAKQGKSYFGPVHFVRGSEPYMTIAVPIERFAGDVIGVLQAEVNLKYIGDVVSAITVGKAGYAYAVTRTGELIAHPDISLVLQRRNVAVLEQVKAAFQSAPGKSAPNAIVADNIQGKSVLTSFALIPGLDWAVIIERPVEEAYETLYASMMRTSTLFLIGLGMALIASWFLARRVVRPVRILSEGVERIGAGDLGYRLDLKTGDEIEVLADEFNKMTAQLQESYSNLEQKVEDRTRELTESLEQQTATSDILGVIASSPTDLQRVLDTVAENAARLCDAAAAGLRVIDGNFHHRVAFFGSTQAPESTELFPVDPDTVSGRAILQRRSIHVHDLALEVDTEYPASKIYLERFGTRTILAMPLLREGIPLGGIVIRRKEVRPFTDKQIALLKTFADQAVIAIENVRLFQEIQEKNEQLETASRYKSQFLANMSHELRTPLNGILGLTEMILDKIYGEVPEKIRSALEDVQASGRHLLNLINDVLDLSKIEAGRATLSLQEYSMREVAQAAFTAMQPLAAAKNLALKIAVPADLPSGKGDQRRITQVLMNLTGNAIKFADSGEVRVDAKAAHDSFLVSVSDTGPGVALADQQRIFEEFQQVDGSSSRAKGGTGLGLAIAKRIIEMHRGHIWVESKVGVGSTFTFSLPVRVERQAEAS